MQRGLPENIQRFLKVKEGQRDLEGAEGREEKAASSLADARTGLQSGGHATAGVSSCGHTPRAEGEMAFQEVGRKC